MVGTYEAWAGKWQRKIVQARFLRRAADEWASGMWRMEGQLPINNDRESMQTSLPHALRACSVECGAVASFVDAARPPHYPRKAATTRRRSRADVFFMAASACAGALC
jgi:hypothetical protein